MFALGIWFDDSRVPVQAVEAMQLIQVVNGSKHRETPGYFLRCVLIGFNTRKGGYVDEIRRLQGCPEPALGELQVKN